VSKINIPVKGVLTNSRPDPNGFRSQISKINHSASNLTVNPRVSTWEFITGSDKAPDPEIAGFRGSRLLFTNIQGGPFTGGEVIHEV